MTVRFETARDAFIRMKKAEAELEIASAEYEFLETYILGDEAVKLHGWLRAEFGVGA